MVTVIEAGRGFDVMVKVLVSEATREMVVVRLVA